MIFLKIITCSQCRMKLSCREIYNGWYCDDCSEKIQDIEITRSLRNAWRN